MDIRSAEMTKYAANAMLATKISFMNEIANICEKVGADANQVRIGIGSDQAIGYQFYISWCRLWRFLFSKRCKSTKKYAKENGYNAQLITAVEEVNDAQKLVLLKKL
jgi:UDPglucose 6-dehydrogenase